MEAQRPGGKDKVGKGAQCYAPIAHSRPSRTRALQGTVRRGTPWIHCSGADQGMLTYLPPATGIASTRPAGTIIPPPPPHPLHQDLSLSPSCFQLSVSLLSSSLSPTYPLHLQSKPDTGRHYHLRVQAKAAFSQTARHPIDTSRRCHLTPHPVPPRPRCQSGTWNIPSDPLFKVPQTWVTLRDHSDLQNIKTLQGTHPLPTVFPARSRSSNEHIYQRYPQPALAKTIHYTTALTTTYAEKFSFCS